MLTGIELMYVEGEVCGGCITGRRVLVIETYYEIDPASPHYCPREIARLIRLAREEWVDQFGPIDLVRLERASEQVLGGRRIAKLVS